MLKACDTQTYEPSFQRLMLNDKQPSKIAEVFFLERLSTSIKMTQKPFKEYSARVLSGANDIRKSIVQASKTTLVNN